jgi:hypothetical protein
MNHHYDIIIVGGGIAGLYSSYLIKKTNPELSFLLLERNKKEWIGGRTGNDEFYGTQVVTGAGVGRKQKDKLLVQLLKELKIKVKECTIQMNYAKTIPQVVDVPKTIAVLKKKYEEMNNQGMNNQTINNIQTQTFSQFAKKILGDRFYQLFTISAGYTDYENEDIHDVLYHYGMDDNHPGWTSLQVPWKKMVSTLCADIGWSHIRYKTTVTKVSGNSCQFIVETNKITYTCNKIIIATNINGIMQLVPGAKGQSSPYQQIKGQPFLRVYGKFSKRSAAIMRKYVPYQTIVPGPLHKIIPMSNDVFMIAYTDNAGANVLKDHLENTIENRELFEEVLEKSLGIEPGELHLIAIKSYYWPIGTHYYKPLAGFKTRQEFIDRIQHPYQGMLVVGEAVSNDQGWTEGALESVHLVLNKHWINAASCSVKTV